jgi:hypothetical protein
MHVRIVYFVNQTADFLACEIRSWPTPVISDAEIHTYPGSSNQAIALAGPPHSAGAQSTSFPGRMSGYIRDIFSNFSQIAKQTSRINFLCYA